MRFRALLTVSAFSILIAYSVGCNNKIFTETPTYPSVCEYISSLPIVEVFSRLLLNRLQAKERVVLSACVSALTGRLRSFFLGTQSRCNKTSAPSKEGVNIYLCTTDIYASVETAQALIKPHAESSFWHEKVASEPVGRHQAKRVQVTFTLVHAKITNVDYVWFTNLQSISFRSVIYQPECEARERMKGIFTEAELNVLSTIWAVLHTAAPYGCKRVF
ncbi:hypothetical protein SprV_0902659300 [Sparganum proliferum]